MYNDVGIVIQRKDGNTMNVFGSTQFAERPPAGDMLTIFLYHLPEDFIVLKSREDFSYIFTQAMPAVFFEGATSATSLPTGKYALFAGYGNEAIGYQMPPVSADTLLEPNSQIADLHAWVGRLITSNKLEFTVPDY